MGGTELCLLQFNQPISLKSVSQQCSSLSCTSQALRAQRMGRVNEQIVEVLVDKSRLGPEFKSLSPEAMLRRIDRHLAEFDSLDKKITELSKALESTRRWRTKVETDIDQTRHAASQTAADVQAFRQEFISLIYIKTNGKAGVVNRLDTTDEKLRVLQGAVESLAQSVETTRQSVETMRKDNSVETVKVGALIDSRKDRATTFKMVGMAFLAAVLSLVGNTIANHWRSSPPPVEAKMPDDVKKFLETLKARSDDAELATNTSAAQAQGRSPRPKPQTRQAKSKPPKSDLQNRIINTENGPYPSDFTAPGYGLQGNR